MSARKIHLSAARDGLDLGLCGMGAPKTVTADPDAVTCAVCKRLMREALTGAQLAMAREMAEHADAAAVIGAVTGLARSIADLAFVPGPPVPVVRGAHELTEGQALLVRRSKAGEDVGDRPRWSSLGKAVERWLVTVDDGAPIRGMTPRDGGGGGRSRGSGRDDMLEVARAIDAAYPTAYIVVGGRRVPRAVARDVLCWRLAGAPYNAHREAREDGRRPVRDKSHLGRHVPTRAQLVELIGRAHGVVLTEHQCSLVFARGAERAEQLLVRKGILDSRTVARAQARRGDRGTKAEGEMALPEGRDVEGWSGVAKALGVGESTARKWHRESGADRMPVFAVRGGLIVATAAELKAWLKRQERAA